MTNREWLKSLNNEEWLENVYIKCVVMHDERCPEVLTCRECRLNWLNAEHKEDNND